MNWWLWGGLGLFWGALALFLTCLVVLVIRDVWREVDQ